MSTATSNLTGFDAGLPANIDAEKTILGAVLLDNEAWTTVVEKLKPGDFSLDSHARIARVMKVLIDRGGTIDIVTLANELAARHEVEAIGGVAYLAGLTEGLPRRPVIDEYIKIVKDKSVLRRLMTACSQTIARCAEQGETALEIVGSLQHDIETLAAPSQDKKRAPLESFIVGALDEMNREYQSRQSPCIPSGNAWFDAKTGGGYRYHNITLICARPNVGKTPWAVMSTVHNLQRGIKVVFFSLEKKKEAIFRDMVPYVTTMPNRVVNNPWMQTSEQNRLINEAVSGICEKTWPLVVYDGKMDVDEICWAIDRETRNGEHVLFIVDHFGMIADGDKRRSTLEAEIYNSARMREKIKEKASALVILRQLKKVNREFANKPPIEDDVKGATNGWEDAFAALIIHRGIEEESGKRSLEPLLNLAKLRTGGSTGNTNGIFNTKTLAFEANAEMDYDSDD